MNPRYVPGDRTREEGCAVRPLHVHFMDDQILEAQVRRAVSLPVEGVVVDDDRFGNNAVLSRVSGTSSPAPGRKS